MPEQSDLKLRNSLISLISLLKHKASDKEVAPIVSTSKVIQLLRNSGMTLTYSQLSKLMEDPMLSSSISSINKDQIEFNLNDEESTPKVEDSVDFDTPNDENIEDASENEETEFPDDDNYQEELPDETPGVDVNLPKNTTVLNMARRAASR